MIKKVPDGKHASLCADGTDLSSGAVRTKPCQQFVTDVALHRHGSGVDAENVDPAFLVRQSEFDFPVQTSGSKKCRVKGIGTIGGHQNLDVTARIKTIQLKANQTN